MRFWPALPSPAIGWAVQSCAQPLQNAHPNTLEGLVSSILLCLLTTALGVDNPVDLQDLDLTACGVNIPEDLQDLDLPACGVNIPMDLHDFGLTVCYWS